jgi:hypothetical protein
MAGQRATCRCVVQEPRRGTWAGHEIAGATGQANLYELIHGLRRSMRYVHPTLLCPTTAMPWSSRCWGAISHPSYTPWRQALCSPDIPWLAQLPCGTPPVLHHSGTRAKCAGYAMQERPAWRHAPCAQYVGASCSHQGVPCGGAQAGACTVQMGCVMRNKPCHAPHLSACP